MHVLVIDDSRTTRSILRRMMSDMGFVVDEAASGNEAIEWLSEHGSIDIAFVDLDMPGMDGVQFLKTVRANPEFKDMRLMMVTTANALESIARALDAGADEYLMKPFTKDSLRDKLRLMGLQPS
ncbi:MAG TPA: response regulator [Deltaproteobacteria bacterium]|nr:response regulator [Deltaproteobacteria bacterium]HCP46074.1 response regulator [Deltaproteobacteria bacterium]